MRTTPRISSTRTLPTKLSLSCRSIAIGVAFLLCAASVPFPAARAQEIHFNTGIPNPSRAARVTLEIDTFTVKAGQSAFIELRFHIAPGLHINSHVPRDETLIPTTFTVDPTSNLRVHYAEFPAGVPFHIEVGAGETLSTYVNDFAVRLQIDPPARGDAALTGKLRYQACDNASCFPPRDLPVQLMIHAR